MNVERMYAVARRLRDDISQTEIQSLMQELVTALQNNVAKGPPIDSTRGVAWIGGGRSG